MSANTCEQVRTGACINECERESSSERARAGAMPQKECERVMGVGGGERAGASELKHEVRSSGRERVRASASGRKRVRANVSGCERECAGASNRDRA